MSKRCEAPGTYGKSPVEMCNGCEEKESCWKELSEKLLKEMVTKELFGEEFVL